MGSTISDKKNIPHGSLMSPNSPRSSLDLQLRSTPLSPRASDRLFMESSQKV